VKRIGIFHLFGAVTLAAVLALASSASAQRTQNQAPPPPQGPPNALQGFSKNRGEPVKIVAASLEVRDKEKMATFTGDVHLVQGDTELRCKTLVIYYEAEPAPAPAPARVATAAPAIPAPGMGGGSQQIRRMEAKGGVTVTQKDQTAVGERGDFDMRANTVTLTGNVVVTKGQDVLRGHKLVVNLTDGVSRMESGGGRVEALIQSTGHKDGHPK
jgi:lipopolysaccharide export system protein LptA